MGRAADGEDRPRVEWLVAMPDYADLERRIDSLCARASSSQPDARLLFEIEDLLAEGYLHALRGDHRIRGLAKHLDALKDSADDADEIRTVVREQRMVTEAKRRLRAKLAVMREHWVALGSDRLGLA